MKVNNWNKIKMIIITGLLTNEPFETIGLSIIDSEKNLNVTRMGDRWALIDEDGLVSKFNSPAEAWTFVGKICIEEYFNEE